MGLDSRGGSDVGVNRLSVASAKQFSDLFAVGVMDSREELLLEVQYEDASQSQLNANGRE